MEINIAVLFTTLFMVLIMEMGDKTQLLVMAMASRYRPQHVFWGISLASILLNLLAVILGTYIGGNQIIQDSVRIGASILFIFFGLLSLREEEPGEGNDRSLSEGVIMTIAIAFFLAEFGDKTQLTAFSLAALYPENPLSVFLGSTVGLIAADCLGLIAGTLVIKWIPKKTIAYASAVLFIFFGLLNGWVTLREHFLLDIKTSALITGIAALVSLFLFVLIICCQKARRR